MVYFRLNLLNNQCLSFHFYCQCVESLAQSSSPSAIELCDLLSTYEMEGLLLAHDRIASTTDRSPALVNAIPDSAATSIAKNTTSNIPNYTNVVNNNNNSSSNSINNNNLTKVSTN